MPKTFVISDTHFGHKNIIEYCSRPKNADELIIQNWHNTVSEEDTVIHLGDVALMGAEKIIGIVGALPGHKHLVRGNHDHGFGTAFWKRAGFESVEKKCELVLVGDTLAVLSHRPLTRDQQIAWRDSALGKKVVNIHGHVHNNEYTTDSVPGVRLINACVEVVGYRPVDIEELIREGE